MKKWMCMVLCVFIDYYDGLIDHVWYLFLWCICDNCVYVWLIDVKLINCNMIEWVYVCIYILCLKCMWMYI